MEGQMTMQTSEVPKHPLPEQPKPSQVQQPMVYVYDRTSWEYKVITKDGAEPMPSEEELNAMGKSGWELAGVAAVPGKVNFFFKRARM
jgi:hypothetical protein